MHSARLAVTCPVVIGRDPVLQLLATASRTARERGLVTLLGGSAGMGKTRLLAEAGRLATAQGHLVLAGECRIESSNAYEPFSSALARYERTLVDAETELLFSGRARPARVLLPTVFSDEPDASDTPERVQAALVEVLRQLSTWTPVTLLLEDLHWASRDALHLVHAVATEVAGMPVWMVGSYRTDEVGTSSAFTRLATLVDRRHPDERIVLDPLEEGEIAAMLRASFPDRTFEPSFVAALHERSGGNPFVVEELCRALLDRGRLRGASDAVIREVDLPATVRTALLGRVDRLSDHARELLSIAAVAGEELDLELIARVTGWDEEHGEACVAEALSAHVVTERHDGPVPYYAFTHALTREAVLGELPTPQRRRLHRQLAHALIEGGDPALAGLVCDHLVAAGDARSAHVHALSAARRAANRLQPGEAARRFEQAIELAPEGPERVAVAVEAAEFGFFADRPRAVPLAERAQRLALAEGDVEHESRALIVLARTRWIVGDPDSFAPFERALGLVEERGDRLELTVLVEAAYHLARTGGLDDARRADALVDRAATFASAVDDDALHARLALTRAARAVDRAGLEAACAEAAVLLARSGNPWADATADLLAGHHLVLFHGDLREGARRLRRHQRVWDQLTTRRPSVPFSGLALATLWMGDADAAQSLLAEGYWADSDLSAANWYEGMAELALARGRVAEALAHGEAGLAVAEEVGEPAWLLPALGTIARARLETDGLAAATPTFERALDLVSRSSMTYHWPFSPAWARALAATGELATLDRVVGVLRDATAAAGDRGHDVAALRYVEGIQRLAQQDLDRAAETLDDADRLYAGMPFPSRRIGVAVARAEVDHRAGRSEEAARRGREALVLARAIGGPLLVERVQRALQQLGRPGRRAEAAVTGSTSLTPREREIVQLTVAGLTAREIGDRLVISHRTVEGHLERARDKLGATSKADLVRLAIQHSL